MKRKLTVVFKQPTPPFLIQGDHFSIEGDFAYSVENLQRFVDVVLLDAQGVSLNQQGMDWTYEDTLDPPLQKGDYCMVPFGWSDNLFLAKVIHAGDEPTYKGVAPIKQVEGRVGIVDE